ncbi:MAG: cytochrome c biogenesis protein [Nanoarchaeota archaeon]|nr:cytochrome c biogenesis protein [Nanoarchaeota archaeon]
MKKILLLLVLLFLISPVVSHAAEQEGDNEVVLFMFYGQGCPHCGKMELFLNRLEEKYPTLKVERYEVYGNQDNRDLFENISNAYDTKVVGVPAVFIDNKVVFGFSNSIGDSIENEVKKCVNEVCCSPRDKLEDFKCTGGIIEKLTIPAVISAAAVDAINPCAFAVLIILLTTILAAKSRKKALFAGLAFSLSIYIAYFLMGIGLFSAIQAAGLSHVFYAIVAVLAIFVGLLNLKDYLWYGKWFIMEVPRSWRPKMKALIKGVTSVPGAFLMGFVVSLFLLPCTSGPYIVILGLLVNTATRNHAFMLLLLYNFIFIIPMIGITLLIYFGIATTEKAEQWRASKLKILHLIAGIIILLLGIGMLIALWLGAV